MYDHTFPGDEFQLFAELNSELNFGDNEDSFANDSLVVLAPSLFLSYFPSQKFTVLVLAQHAQRFDLGNDFPQDYSVLGAGAKYQLSKSGQHRNSVYQVCEEPLYIGDQSTIYLYQNSSYELLGSYELNFKNRVQLGLSLFSEHYKATKAVTSLNLPNEVETNKQLIKLIYTHQNLDYYYFYIQGFKSVFNGQFVTANNTAKNNFFIAWNDFLYYKRVGARGNWANRLRLGLSTNNESPFAPFSLDNNINLRGVGNAVDRGAGGIVFNTEYRYTLVDKKNIALQSNGFIDVGSWRTPGKSLRTFADSENIQVYSGVGFRLIHKKIANFNFRIDYGYGLTKNANRGFVFGIGQYF